MYATFSPITIICLAAFIFEISEAEVQFKTVLTNEKVSFTCDTPGIPMWLMKNRVQRRMHGIGVGTERQSGFTNLRFDIV